MVSAWFINSARTKAIGEAMTSFIQVSIPGRIAETGRGLWLLTVTKKIKKAVRCTAAGNGRSMRQSHSLTFATQRGVMPQVHSAQLVQPRLTEKRIDRPIFDRDRKSTRLNSSHRCISYAVFCL